MNPEITFKILTVLTRRDPVTDQYHCDCHWAVKSVTFEIERKLHGMVFRHWCSSSIVTKKTDEHPTNHRLYSKLRAFFSYLALFWFRLSVKMAESKLVRAYRLARFRLFWKWASKFSTRKMKWVLQDIRYCALTSRCFVMNLRIYAHEMLLYPWVM